MEKTWPSLFQAAQADIPVPAQNSATVAQRCEPVTGALAGHLGFLAPVLDPRVLRRAARELWTSTAEVRARPTAPRGFSPSINPENPR